MIDGQFVVRDRQFTTLNEQEIISTASDEAARLTRAIVP